MSRRKIYINENKEKIKKAAKALPKAINRKNKPKMSGMTLNSAIAKAVEAADWLKAQDTDMRILIKQTRNLGDTLHITPIARHYKTVYPNCKIAFLVGHQYASVHEHNKDFDKIIAINGGLGSQDRIKLGQFMVNNLKGLNKVLCPSIFPFGEVWKSHTWSHAVISHQYWHNAGIRPPSEIQGGHRLHAPITDQDKSFARSFVGDKKCIALEYNSYSHPVPWNAAGFEKFVQLSKNKSYQCISIAGKQEGIIKGSIDGRGLSWRHTIAVLSMCKYIIGIGSGISMLACCANPKPQLIEINVSESVGLKQCGYNDEAILVTEATPEKVMRHIL